MLTITVHAAAQRITQDLTGSFPYASSEGIGEKSPPWDTSQNLNYSLDLQRNLSLSIAEGSGGNPRYSSDLSKHSVFNMHFLQSSVKCTIF